MRTDWVSPSAATLVVGGFAMVMGSLLNPASGGEGARAVLRVVNENDGRLLAMAVFYFLASLCLMLGLPSLLSVFARRGWRLGVTAVLVFSVGVLGTAGFSMLLVLFRALVLEGAVSAASLDDLAGDLGLLLFVSLWIAGFYGGLVLIAVALLVARATPVWVPGLFLLTVVLSPFGESLGSVGSAVQPLALAVGLTGVAVAAVASDQERRLLRAAELQ